MEVDHTTFDFVLGGRAIMVIKADKVVTFHYRLSEFGGKILENSHRGQPIVYLHGHRGMIPALEGALEGRAVGDQFSTTLKPEEAYGEHREGKQQRVPIKHLVKKGRLKPGMVVKLKTKEGSRDVTLVKVGKFNVDVDTNHPLAGKTLTFEVDVIDIRDASSEESAHGHVHGKGGHHH